MHPFSGFALWLWFSVSAWLLPLHLPLAIVTLLPSLALMRSPDGRQRLRWCASILIPLALGLALIHSQLLGYWLGTKSDWQQPWSAVTLWLKIAATLLAAQLWLLHCPIPKLINALLGSRLPSSLSYLLAAPLLLIDPIKRQMQQIRMAQLARGVPLDGNLWQRLTALPSMVMPLLAGQLNGVAQRGATLEQRGFRGAATRTNWNAPEDTKTQQRCRMVILLLIAIEITGTLFWR